MNEKDYVKADSPYDWKCLVCPDPETLQKHLNHYSKFAGHYIYVIPQAKGCILRIGIPNPKSVQVKGQEPKVTMGFKPLTELEAKKIPVRCEYIREEHLVAVDNFLTWMYENSMKIVKQVKEEKP